MYCFLTLIILRIDFYLLRTFVLILVFFFFLWKAVITGDNVTRLIIPIRGRSKSPEEGQR